MDLDEVAAVEIAAARARVERRAPARESAPDPSELPPLPVSPLEVPAPAPPGLPDHVPDRFLDDPPRDFRVWAEIYRRNLRFRFRSHRPGSGRVIVWLKRLLAPLLRSALSDERDRDRIFHLVLVDWLEQIARYQRDLRDPYSFVRDWAVPDLVARMDALFALAERRLDALETLRPPAAPPLAEWPLLSLAVCRASHRALVWAGEADPAWQLLARAGMDLTRIEPGLAGLERLRRLANGSVGAAVVAADLACLPADAVVDALRVLHGKLAEGAPLLVHAPRRALAYSLVLPALGFRPRKGAADVTVAVDFALAEK
jgi:hypothetical protein